MKTIQDIHSEIDILLADLKKAKDAGNLRAAKKYAEEVLILRSYKVYLESAPREEYLRKEEVRITELLDRLQERFMAECEEFRRHSGGEIPNSTLAVMRAKHAKAYDITGLKAKLKTLKYLLT
jgi:hypothetical protein